MHFITVSEQLAAALPYLYYDKPFKSREDALTFALKELKDMMTEKIGNIDTTNYKQPIILATLRAIDKVLVSRIQLALF